MFFGKVLDEESEDPMIGAVVSTGSGKGTTSDYEGAFNLLVSTQLKSIEISYLGYETVVVELDGVRKDLGTITLGIASTTLDEIVVSASEMSYKSSFKGSNFRVDPIDVKNINPLCTEEILRTIPGVNIVGDMGLSNRPNISIRGSWGRRSKKILLMEDGSPAAPAPYIAPGAYYNPVSDRVTSVEVYKGADMLRYGPNNMYGAVNYITALPPQRPELRVKLVGGQRNYTTGLLSYGGTWNKLGMLFEGVYKRFDGFTDNSSVEVLNLNAKLFAQISDDQSIYFKVSAQFEDNQASLTSQTPFTFEADPVQNPFDADQFTMRRYGLDLIHKWLPAEHISLTSKVYLSDFERDWWRQITRKVKAAEVRDYVGDEIFDQRYSYMRGLEFGDEDYVVTGKITNGRESTGDSRWAFTVTGVRETLRLGWSAWGNDHEFEAGVKLHQESYKDRFHTADSSRWARSGTVTKDLKYHLWSASGYLRNDFHFGRFGVTPILRYEYIDMFRQDLLAQASNPDLDGTDDGRQYNRYHVLLPGVTIDYRIKGGEVFGSIYRGFIAPSKIFGFLSEQDGMITNPIAGDDINIQPEYSLNTELGWRGGLFEGRIDGQMAYFNNTVSNFYAAGRNEVFVELGRINIQGIEVGLGAEVFRNPSHRLVFSGNATLLRTKVLSGKLDDRDLFGQVIHSTATEQEYIDRVNSNRDAYEIYVTNSAGEEVLFTGEVITRADFDKISRSLLEFGDNGISDGKAPYSPEINITLGFDYTWKKLSAGLKGNFVGSQYGEFNNFANESADGAIGQLPSFFTMDAYVNYDATFGSKMKCNFFINGKNIADNVYRASRLNRATSGIFPGGFRQIIFGVNILI